jgi:putative membrane protein
MPEKPQDDPRVYFAAERTFLAWIRTGLGLMGVGFAVSRFGLFLREMSAQRNQMPAHTTGLSVWSGVALVALGVVVNVSGVVRHFQIVKELKTGTWAAGHVSRSAVALALVLAAAGVGLMAYLVLVR